MIWTLIKSSIDNKGSILYELYIRFPVNKFEVDSFGPNLSQSGIYSYIGNND